MRSKGGPQSTSLANTEGRFVRPDILFYEAQRIDLYQSICALYEEVRTASPKLRQSAR